MVTTYLYHFDSSPSLDPNRLFSLKVRISNLYHHNDIKMRIMEPFAQDSSIALSKYCRLSKGFLHSSLQNSAYTWREAVMRFSQYAYSLEMELDKTHLAVASVDTVVET